MYRWLLHNPIFANTAFVLVIALGVAAYLTLARQQDPSVNFNWVEIHTRFPGASAMDVEERVTDVLEKGVQRADDVRFSRSESRAGFSRIIVRFRNLDEAAFDDHVTELRREIQNRTAELPAGAETPEFLKINSDNHVPAVLLLVVGRAFDGNLRRQADRVADDVERFTSVDRVDRLGMRRPELQVRFDASRMQGLGVSPATLADTIRAYFRDSAVGSLALNEREWLVRLAGTRNDPAYLENLPLVAAHGEVPLRSVARVARGFDKPSEMVEYHGQPAVLIPIYKDAESNLFGLVDRVGAYTRAHNERASSTGVRLVILDDQTDVTRRALEVMESNAVIGLALVLAVTWALLGLRIAAAASLGIPFALAGTLAVAAVFGETLNVVVLLGLVISLGMLVDDAVVVAEAIHERLRRGERALEAVLSALREVGTPVFASVMTTVAAFLPLMFIPGVLGDYMQVAPLIVTVALLVSLIEAFWILPAHVVAGASTANITTGRGGRLRAEVTRWLRNRYARLVIRVLRHPRVLGVGACFLLTGVIAIVASGWLRIDYFATDSARRFYINVDMPPGTSLTKTLATTSAVEAAVRPHIDAAAVHAMASYAGIQLAQADTVMSHNVGQVAVSLRPRTAAGRSVDDIIAGIETAARSVPGPDNLAFLQVRTGPPTQPPVSVKLRGDQLPSLAAAAADLKTMLAGMEAVRDVRDDDVARRMELQLRLNPDALVRTGLDPATVTRAVQLLADGEVVASMRDRGDTIDVRVRAEHARANPLDEFLGTTLNLPAGGTVALGQLVDARSEATRGSIRHQNLRRAITVSAELAGTRSDTLSVNREIRRRWESELAARYPGVGIDFSGEMDDIKESLRSLGIYLLFGVVLIYLILGSQFRSYFQPLIVLAMVPTAFTGVIIGLALSGYALSLYTLYGAVALVGIAVNSAIVFISAANDRIRAGMTTAQATVFAARRRVVPILIASITTMAGLFSLAVGLAGHSNVWGPVASAIVWGLGVSTLLTLLVAPALYARFAPRARARAGIELVALPVLLDSPRGGVARARAVVTGEWAEQQRYRDDRQAIAADRRLAAAYRKGREYLQERDYLAALKLFQYLAEKQPDSVLANRAAAHAAIAVLHSHGADPGYDARARRFLTRGLRGAPQAADLLALKGLYQEMGLPAKPAVQSP